MNTRISTVRDTLWSFILLFAVCAATPLANAQISWTNTSGGNWSNPANWSPNLVPGPTDSVNISAAGTYAITLDVNATVANLDIGGASGTQTLQANGFTLDTTNATVGNGAVVSLNGVTMFGAITVANGAVLSLNGYNGYSTTLAAQVTVANGGELLVTGNGASIGQSYSNGLTNDWLWVQSGGQVDVATFGYDYLSLNAVMTNAGTVNLTGPGAYGFVIEINNNGGSSFDGGLVNQAGGVINLVGTGGFYGAVISGGNGSGGSGSDYLINQGTINLTNGNGTISVDNFTNPGTVATLPSAGTLQMGSFNGLGSLSGTYNATVGTTIQFVGDNNPGAGAGAGLILEGAGQHQFVSGTLILPTNVIPGLAMTGGNLVLGAGFQGGTITNLSLDGITLTNSLPISGTLALTNYTTTLYGAVTVTNGGELIVNGSTLDGQVTVANGGELLVTGNGASIGQSYSNGLTNDWLWVQSGGQVDVTVFLYSYLILNAAMTNAGTVNIDGSGESAQQGVEINNNGGSYFDGGLVNQAGGVINLISNGNIYGSNGSGGNGSDYLVNEGVINVTNGSSTISVDNLTNLNTLNAQLATLQLQSANPSLASGSLDVTLASPTDYGSFSIAGNAALTGAFVVNLLNGYIPPPGTSYSVFSYGALSGKFTSFVFPSLQPVRIWQPTYGSTELTLTVHLPIFVQPSRTNIVVNLNGPPGQQVILLTSTNPAMPLVDWMPLATNTIDATTWFGVTNNINLNPPYQFFIFKFP